MKYINSKESNGSLKSFTGIKAQSYVHSYSFILLLSENDKTVPSIVCDFHRKWDERGTFSLLSKKEMSRFHI